MTTSIESIGANKRGQLTTAAGRGATGISGSALASKAGAALTLALAVVTLPAGAVRSPGGVGDPLEGVWRVTRHGVDCQSGEQLSTFMAITTFARDGTVVGFGVPPGSSPAMGSPEYGIWKREDAAKSYSFRLLSYAYDATGAFDGSSEVAAQLALARGGDNFAYTATIAFYDAAGNHLFSVCGAATGLRF